MALQSTMMASVIGVPRNAPATPQSQPQNTTATRITSGDSAIRLPYSRGSSQLPITCSMAARPSPSRSALAGSSVRKA